MFFFFFDFSEEDEKKIREYFNPEFFDTEKVVDYVKRNDQISFGELSSFLTKKGEKYISYDFLDKTNIVPRTKFMKRICIYFHDIKEKNQKYMLEPLLNSYSLRYKKESSSVQNKIDFEPLYEMLEKSMDFCGVTIDEILRYMVLQCGTVSNYSFFKTWYDYVSLIEKKFNTDYPEGEVFPYNLLHSYNVERIQHNIDPIIYNLDNLRFSKVGNEKVIQILGFFPFDEDNNPDLNWIALWSNNLVFKKIYTYSKSSDIATLNINDCRLYVGIEFYYDSNSYIYTLEEYSSPNGIVREWKEYLRHIQDLKFDFKKLSFFRERKNLSQKDVAERTGISYRTYQRFEAGESIPDANSLFKLMKIFSIFSIDDLIVHNSIRDDNFKKFLSGKGLQYYLDSEE